MQRQRCVIRKMERLTFELLPFLFARPSSSFPLRLSFLLTPFSSGRFSTPGTGPDWASSRARLGFGLVNV